MKKGFTLVMLFVLSFSFLNCDFSDSNKYEKIIFLSDYTSNPMSGDNLDINSIEGSSTTLVYELKNNFDPNDVWESFEFEYGEITKENVDFALQYFQEGMALHYLELKMAFMSSSGYELSNEVLFSASPYITVELQYFVNNINELESYFIDLALNEDVYQLAVIPAFGGLPFTEIDDGGGGTSTCESNKFLDVRNAIQYDEFNYWYQNSDGSQEVREVSGSGINIAIVEGVNEGSFYGLVEKNYILNEGLSNETNVFGTRVHWNPYYELDNTITSGTHATDVAHIAAGYNGIAYNSNIFSVDYRNDIDLYSYPEYKIATGVYAPISDYLLNVRPEYATAQRAHVTNISAGISVLSGSSQTELHYFNKLYNQYVYSNNMIFVAAAGNHSNQYVGAPSSASNVFAVGGSNNDGDDYYLTATNATSYIDLNNGIQKPNILAPAVIDLSLDTSCDTDPIDGTSFAAPLVTGAIASLLEYNPLLKAKPSEVFALLTATASNQNFPSSSENTYDENIGNKSGAGLLQYYNLLNNSENTFTKYFTSSTPDFEEVIENINPENYYKTLRVALFWMTKIENNQELLNDYKLEVYFDNQLVGSSDSATNNSELVISNINTNGTLVIKITRKGTFLGNNNDNIGVAWALTDN